MSIERDRKYKINDFVCDGRGCDERVAFDPDGEWKDELTLLREEGWLITKEHGEWKHYCEDCKDG